MIKRFYQSYNAVKYSIPMSMLAFVIFIESYIYTNRRIQSLRICMIFTALVLAVIMFVYYHNKIKINKVFKNISNPDEYERGGCVDRSWFLENRMLVSDRKNICEYPVKGIRSITLIEGKHGKYLLHIEQGDQSYNISLTDKESGERLTAFLLKKNPGVKLTDIHPRGNGTLKELGAEYGKNAG